MQLTPALTDYPMEDSQDFSSLAKELPTPTFDAQLVNVKTEWLTILSGIIEQLKSGTGDLSQRLRFIISATIADINELINSFLNDVLHHQQFQKLEASWRGLSYLVDTQADYDNDVAVKVKVLNVSWKELGRDLSRAIEFDQSLFFQRLYSDEYDTPGGEPFGLLIGDYYVSHKSTPSSSVNDIESLREIGLVCTAALCPFVTGANSNLLGMESFAELDRPMDLAKIFKHPDYLRWNQLRSDESSRFIGLTLPHVLMRQPYANDGSRWGEIQFTETARHTDTDYLWGNAAYGFGGVLIRAFANTGWFADIRGGIHEFGEGGVVNNLHYSPVDNNHKHMINRAGTNVAIDDILERELSHQGLIPLCSYHSDNHSVFYSNSSLHHPKNYTTEIATANARLSSMIQYMMCVSRFGHYLKVIGRDRIGSVISAEDCQRVFQNWLNQYTTNSELANSTIKARYPLAESQVEIREQPGRIGSFNCVVHLKPHFQLDQLVSSIKLVTELSLGKVGTKL